jgi:hypothetical protein
MKPVDARKEVNSEAVWHNLYGVNLENTFGKQTFKVSDSHEGNTMRRIMGNSLAIIIHSSLQIR